MEGLTKYGIITEDWGRRCGAASRCRLTGMGINDLLERVALEAGHGLKARPQPPRQGAVVEPSGQGPGLTATILVQGGTCTPAM